MKKETIEDVMPQLLPYLQFAGISYVKGKLFDLFEYPGAICDDNLDNKVFGELFTIIPAFEKKVFVWLDDYEGYYEMNIVGSLFRRERVTVYKKESKVVNAWIYWYNKPVAGLTKIVSGVYNKK